MTNSETIRKNGSINLLSYGSSEESIMRLESRELATELETSINFNLVD